MITKNEMEKYVNSFSGDFREVFIEKSKSIKFNILNGKVKTPRINEDSGISFLSRSGKSEFFKSISGENFDIKTEISKFIKENDLSTKCEKFPLNGQKEINISNNIEFEEISTILLNSEKAFAKYFDGKIFIKASNIILNFTKSTFVVGNTAGNFAGDSTFYNTIYISLVGEKDGKTEEVVEKITGVDILDSFSEDKINEIFEKSLEQLDLQFRAEKSPNGEMFVVVGNEAGGTIIHEAVGHGLEGDLQGSSVYSGKIGEKVADESVTIVDDPTIENERGFYNYDHEGNPSKKTILIENGILKSYLHTEKTAKKFGVNSTGHARKENYRYRNLVRMGTTYLAPGKDKKEDILSKVDSGIYVSKMGGGQVDTITGDFVFEVKYGFIIENGELKNEIRGATISGNGPEMLNRIYGICDDLNFIDGGTCGKGQAMPVSDANPTFLTKLKVTGLN